MVKVLVVEDERRIGRYIENIVRAYLGEELECLERAETWPAASAIVTRTHFDLLLLDLNLKGVDGFALLAHCRSADYKTIVISAYRERALEAFEHGVLDFVLKPFKRARLEKALARFLAEARRRPVAGQPAGQGEAASRSDGVVRSLAIKRPGRTTRVALTAVCYIKAAGHYSELHLDEGSPRLHHQSLDRLEQILPPHFVRIHRGYIANLELAREIRNMPGSSYALVLDDGTALPIGRTRLQQLRARFA
ncbi:Response regulator transcription factor [Sulfidibacter corallicola]|uniref:Response regulator transcription factor n=1 Tax=Sulfidibacter corallicola TaxID=2818388 RepID=A0A8A4TTY9_SULCO|nr:LytTR family DNA-binding domain-containing protein [Sulfidibacter corallicola]QTD52502.1 response regulator transcription factor [Sulfidibacter corallicola]